jgi:glucosyl-dolichyl phosphate glucuronosyltransferase
MNASRSLSWELVVLNNNSTDDTREVLANFQRQANISLTVLFEARQGKSFAMNAGISAAKGDILVLTDDDVRVDPNWLIHIKEAFDRYDCAGLGGKIIPEWTFQKPSWVVEEGPYKLIDLHGRYDLGDEPCEITMRTRPYGANMAFRKQMFDKYGLFRTDLGPAGTARMTGQDIEFSRRLLEGGEKLIYLPQAVVYHLVEKQRISKTYYRHAYFAFGRGSARRWEAPDEAVRYFGIPRYLLPGLLGKTLKWLSAVDRERRFYYKMQAYQCAGEIYEARQMFIEANHRESASHSGPTAQAN